MTDTKTYSIQLRVRRVIHEDAFVSVPVTDAITKLDDEGNRKIDVEAFVAAGLRLAEESAVTWEREGVERMPHPVQTPLPEGRTSFQGPFPRK